MINRAFALIIACLLFAAAPSLAASLDAVPAVLEPIGAGVLGVGAFVVGVLVLLRTRRRAGSAADLRS
jgi:hypothetical protein